MPYFVNELESEGNKTLVGVLQDFGNTLQNELRTNLQKKVKGFTSKTLEQSIVFDITVSGTSYHFTLYMEEYGDYIDQGVQGKGGTRKTTTAYGKKGNAYRNVAPQSRYRYDAKKPPKKALELWSRLHGINVYALQESIYRKGIKPNYFYSEVVTDDLFRDLSFELLDMGARSIEIELSNAINNGNNN